MVTLRKLLSSAFPDFSRLEEYPDIPITGVECDSRKVGKGFLFLAVRGEKADGHRFIGEALSRGAAAIAGDEPQTLPQTVPFIRVTETREAAARLASAFYGHPSKALTMVGVTGTNGKTTSCYLLEHLLKNSGQKVGVLGTIDYRFSGVRIPAVETTPGPLKLQELFSKIKAAGCRYVFMEVSSHSLAQKRVDGIGFKAALFTNLTQDHLDYHGSIEAYFEAKARLFTGLPQEAAAVLNADDPWVMKIKGKTRARVLTFGVRREADLKAEDIVYGFDSTRFDLAYSGKKMRVHSPLAGSHNVYNILGALGVFLSLGQDLASAAKALESFPGVPGRLERVDCGQDFSVFVDFAHTPDGLENVLSSLEPYKKRNLYVVFGCGGDRDRTKRPKMGRIAAQHCDFVYVTSDNPRSEDPKEIMKEVAAGFPKDFKNYQMAPDRHKAIRQALMRARKDDIVVLAGKGHETSQVIGDKVLPFNDRQEAEKVLNGR